MRRYVYAVAAAVLVAARSREDFQRYDWALSRAWENCNLVYGPLRVHGSFALREIILGALWVAPRRGEARAAIVAAASGTVDTLGTYQGVRALGRPRAVFTACLAMPDD